MTQHQYKVGDRVIVSDDAAGIATSYRGETVTLTRLTIMGNYAYETEGGTEGVLYPDEIAGLVEEGPPVLKQGRLWQVRERRSILSQGYLFPDEFDCVAILKDIRDEDDAFDLTANPHMPHEERMARMTLLRPNVDSMSGMACSIVEIDGVFHLCKTFGWDVITEFPSRVNCWDGVTK